MQERTRAVRDTTQNRVGAATAAAEESAAPKAASSAATEVERNELRRIRTWDVGRMPRPATQDSARRT
jgi:hypothetical protein